ncbi:MAG TPA: polysaccharide pyruvyl transferase family protein, partial [Candidatus Rifleibacterium sp.]|nr:polysaccharide pyruvyl transferase family protein [Candidatus Rifleibacterium sp.]
LVSFARLCGARVLLPAQGLGPFRKDNVLDRLLTGWLAVELAQAAYFSVRDSQSADLAKEIAGVVPVNAGADLVFLNEIQADGRPAKHKGNLRVAAIIRSSVAGSEKIAADLVSMKGELENLTLTPVAFQPEEDERVWRRAGWQGDILYAREPLQALAAFDVVISMRLHGCIVATSLSIPWVGIAYDPKVTAFAAACRWQFCCQPAELTRNWLEEKLNVIAGRRQEFADRLHRITGENRRAVGEDFAGMLQKV